MKRYTFDQLGKILATNSEWHPLNILMLDVNINEMFAIVAEPVAIDKWIKHKLQIRFSRKCGNWYVILHGRRLHSGNFIKVNVGE